MTIKTDMRELIKHATTQGLCFKMISKEEIFKHIKGTDEEKQNALIHMLEDGEIYEKHPNKFLWLGE